MTDHDNDDRLFKRADNFVGENGASSATTPIDLEPDESFVYGMRLGRGPSKAKTIAAQIAAAMAGEAYQNAGHPLHNGVRAEVQDLFEAADVIRREQERDRQGKR